MRNAIDDLALDHLWILYPGNNSWQADKKVTVLPLSNIKGIKALM
jgi:hypothetical protein